MTARQSIEAEVAAEIRDGVAARKREILRDEYFELDIMLAVFCYIEPSDPGTDYRGFTEINRIMFRGQVFDAQDFPREFVRALEKELGS